MYSIKRELVALKHVHIVATVVESAQLWLKNFKNFQKAALTKLCVFCFCFNFLLSIALKEKFYYIQYSLVEKESLGSHTPGD